MNAAETNDWRRFVEANADPSCKSCEGRGILYDLNERPVECGCIKITYVPPWEKEQLNGTEDRR